MKKWFKYIFAPWKVWDYYYDKELEIALYLMNKKEKEKENEPNKNL